eukprot:7618083-Alexandrium_andersonii.AAC.1
MPPPAGRRARKANISLWNNRNWRKFEKFPTVSHGPDDQIFIAFDRSPKQARIEGETKKLGLAIRETIDALSLIHI